MKLFCVTVIAAAMAVGSAAKDQAVSFITPGAGEKCPVCGMFVAKYPDWVAEIVFRDGSHVVFDGPKDMFKYFFDPKKYDPGKNAAEVAALFVSDYYELNPIDGLEAFYVDKSDVYGPMGRELIPFKTLSAASDFMVDHRGERVIRMNDVKTLLKSLDE